MPASPTVVVIINPIAGGGIRLDRARDRGELAAAIIRGRGFDPEVFITERPGHARELAGAALARGAATVVAWGGDGTVNEVASALAFRETTLGIVPSGSGNGLARELGIPPSAGAALDVAVGAGRRRIDAGEMDGRLFFNVGGIGLDALVARRFAAHTRLPRGFLRYVVLAVSEIFAYRPAPLTITADGDTQHVRVLLLAVANGRQYGNGALIAPSACIDDGRLDLVVVNARSPLGVLISAPRLFTGRIGSVAGVATRQVATVDVSAPPPIVCHVDGEPFTGGASVRIRVRPAALWVASPPAARAAGSTGSR